MLACRHNRSRDRRVLPRVPPLLANLGNPLNGPALFPVVTDDGMDVVVRPGEDRVDAHGFCSTQRLLDPFRSAVVHHFLVAFRVLMGEPTEGIAPNAEPRDLKTTYHCLSRDLSPSSTHAASSLVMQTDRLVFNTGAGCKMKIKHLGLWEINPAEVWSVKACPPSVWRARPPPKPTGKTQEYHLDYSHRGVRLLWAGGDEYILFPHDWQFSTSKWPRCSLPPHVTTPPPRSVLGLKGIPTTSWAAFFIDTQGKIAYTSTHKKGVLIHKGMMYVKGAVVSFRIRIFCF